MNTVFESIGRCRPAAVLRGILALAVTMGLGVALAAQTDISNSPLSSTVGAQVKPNVMLLMDTSASMGWGHMPDEVESVTGITSIGYKSAQCNVLYYNPTTKYDLPKKPDLSLFPQPPFLAAPYAGYVAYFDLSERTGKNITNVNLSSAFQAYDYDPVTDRGTLRTKGSNDAQQAAYYYVYNTGTQALRYDSQACQQIDTNVSTAADGGGTWTRVLVSATSGIPGSLVGVDERENFARWYSYYRTRIGLIKSAASLAFSPLSDSYRVGFITVQPKTNPTDSTINAAKNYVSIADFNSTQRGLWFNKIFSQAPGGASPAREGLARVGRHYAGKQDGINAGMTGDPVQYSCQQNFTIMTTDGYWNAQTESPGGGPVQIDGSTLVANRSITALLNPDGNIDDPNSPRPIYDGSSDRKKVVTDKFNTFAHAPCGTFYNVSTAQISKSTSQLTAATSQLTQSTSQLNMRTSQLSRNTSQLTRSTSQLQLTNTQLQRSTAQLNISTVLFQRSTSALQASTSQLTRSTLQTRVATSQVEKRTSQITAKMTKTSRVTTQKVSCDSRTELCTPVASCPAGPFLSCQTNTTGPTLVASCTAAAADAGNNFVATTCPETVTGPTGVASCTPAAASAVNGYGAVTCNTVSSGPTFVASCTAAAASSGNSYVTTTCNPIVTAPTAVATCNPIAASSGNNWTTTTCPNVVTGPTGVASCSPISASAANSFTATTCATVNNGPTGAASCSNTPAGPGNSYTATTCNTATTGPTAVASCTGASANSSNGYTTTTCATTNTGPTPTGSCTNATPNSGNGFVRTTCSTARTGPTNVGTCAGVTANAGNNWTATTCNTVNVGVPTGVATCTISGPNGGGAGVNCGTATTGPTGVASCTPAVASAGNNYTTTTCNTVLTGPTLVATCTGAPAGAGNAYTATTCANVTTGPTPVGSCTSALASAGNNFVGTTCATDTSTPVGVGTCAGVAAAAGNNWTATNCNTVSGVPTGVAACTAAAALPGNGYTATTCNTVTTGPSLAASCVTAAASSANSWTATTCSTATTGPTLATTCTAASPNAGNNYVATTCAPVPGKKIQYVTTTTTTTTEFSGSTGVSAPVVVTTQGATTDFEGVGVCYAPGAEPALPSPNPQTAGPDGTCTTWPCTVFERNDKGSFNSLADVAQYYYVTDLRPTMDNNIEAKRTGTEDDRATWQHMTTFTLGLGVSGTLTYDPNYRSTSQLTGHFAEIRTGARDWPLWPDPALDYSSGEAWNNPKSIDDYWHTAVNGRGKYFSAGDPTSVVSGLGAALAGINERAAAGSAAGASSLQPTAGDNFAFVASYVTGAWTGEVRAELIDLTTGQIGSYKKDASGAILKDSNGVAIRSDPVWSAMKEVDALTGSDCDNRKIYLVRPGATDTLVNFTWNTWACDGASLRTGSPDVGVLTAAEKANFTGVNVTLLGQYPEMNAGQRTDVAGENLVNFLRGQKGKEGFEAGVANKLYRTRVSALGDIVNSQPVYVKAPFASYGDTGYDAFKIANASRAPMVYVGANDGMLHAFYAGTSVTDADRGKEAWALIPSTVLPNLYKLADTNYANIHQYSVDGTPTVSDAYDSVAGAWKTVLVGGLNGGGKGYYAVDVTNPVSPKILWEFKLGGTCYPAATRSDCNLGYTFGRPIVSKLTSGQWVVMFTSGYNNVNSVAGDGGGYLYVLDAFTGTIMQKIPTYVGDATTPSGLGQINNFVDNASVNNTTLRVYGADMLGNVWRFDVNDNQPPTGLEASLIGTAKDNSAFKNPQPITARPELAEINGKPMIFVATGRFLGATDVSDKQVQSIYGIVDPLTGNPAYTDLRGALRPLEISTVGTERTVACLGSTADCGSTNGWVVNLPEQGERVNVNMELVLGTLIVGSNVPGGDACSAGGHAWINFLNFSTGLAVPGSTSVSTFIDGGLIVGVKTIQLNDEFKTEVSKSNTEIKPVDPPVPPAIPRGNRISWREIAQ
jgi:Tfp pilus tip-associated adhesin PilY1